MLVASMTTVFLVGVGGGGGVGAGDVVLGGVIAGAAFDEELALLSVRALLLHDETGNGLRSLSRLRELEPGGQPPEPSRRLKRKLSRSCIASRRTSSGAADPIATCA
jgi:hypothetical protein